MGSSAKKKLEKKKDFQKPKLKVGKAKPKQANQTDTSFRSKAIILNQQSIRTEAPDKAHQFLHHVSLLAARSDSQRKESLAHLTSFVETRDVQFSLPLSISTLVEKCCPLMLDGNIGVRNQLSKLLQTIPVKDIRDQVLKMLPFIRAALTHLSSDIRKNALENLSWLLTAAGDELVSCPGGWSRTLESCTTLLGWRNPSDSTPWSSSRASFRSDAKATARAVQVLEQLIIVGLEEDNTRATTEQATIMLNFPLWDLDHHEIPSKSNAFAYLNLFGAPLDDDGKMLEDREERLAIFNVRFRPGIMVGVTAARKEGGDVGRTSGQLAKVLEKLALEN